VTATPDALLVAESPPHVAPLHPLPDSAQFTPLFELSLTTVAVNAWFCPTITDGVPGEIVTEIAAGGVTGGVTGGAGCFVVDPVQPPSPAMRTIANPARNAGVPLVCARINAGLPYFRLSRFQVSKAGDSVYVREVLGLSTESARRSPIGYRTKGQGELNRVAQPFLAVRCNRTKKWGRRASRRPHCTPLIVGSVFSLEAIRTRQSPQT
jgi:hypothetical protein